MKTVFYSLIILVFFSCEKEKQVLKVMTYNIRYDNPNDGENQWSKRKTFLSGQIAFFQPQVFGIQEGLVHQVKYLDSVFADYSYVGVGRDDGKTKGEYCAIFYDHTRLKVINEATFWLSESPDEISVGWDASMERICTYALFEDKISKKRIWIFNAHFDHIGNIARLQSSKLILEKIKEFNADEIPVVLMGDFNLKPTSNPIQHISTVLNDSKEVSVEKIFGPNGTFNGFKHNKIVTDRIDYIFTSKANLKVNKYAVLSDSRDCKYPSDHLPVYIEIVF